MEKKMGSIREIEQWSEVKLGRRFEK